MYIYVTMMGTKECSPQMFVVAFLFFYITRQLIQNCFHHFRNHLLNIKGKTNNCKI